MGGEVASGRRRPSLASASFNLPEDYTRRRRPPCPPRLRSSSINQAFSKACHYPLPLSFASSKDFFSLSTRRGKSSLRPFSSKIGFSPRVGLAWPGLAWRGVAASPPSVGIGKRQIEVGGGNSECWRETSSSFEMDASPSKRVWRDGVGGGGGGNCISSFQWHLREQADTFFPSRHSGHTPFPRRPPLVQEVGGMGFPFRPGIDLSQPGRKGGWRGLSREKVSLGWQGRKEERPMDGRGRGRRRAEAKLGRKPFSAIWYADDERRRRRPASRAPARSLFPPFYWTPLLLSASSQAHTRSL